MIGTRTTALAAATLAVAAAANAQPELDAEFVAGGLERPIFLTHAPGDESRLFVIEKRGRIRIIKDGTLLPTPFIDLDAIIGGGTSDNSEQGLLGLAFHPDYDTNGYFYVDYTANSDAFGQEDTIIARYSVDPANPDIADPNSGVQLIRIDQPFSNHNGGWIEFGPNDGYLYVAMGDGGSANDPGNRAQTITNQLLGKILRLDVDADDFPDDDERNYAIPQDNPFVGVAGDDEIWAYGLRNPYRCGFDSVTGDLYIGDVGQDSREEVDFQPFDSTGGVNYGWRCMEGTTCTGLSGCTCNAPELTLPVVDYSHFGGGPFVCSVIGGYPYRGCAIEGLQGRYFYADYCSDQVFTLVMVDGVATDQVQVQNMLTPDVGDVDNIVAFGEDALGELYVVDQQDGHIFKIVAADGSNACPKDCAADCDGNGELNVLDFVCFQNEWQAQNPAGDCDDNGAFNILDFVCYQGLFQQGCP